MFLNELKAGERAVVRSVGGEGRCGSTSSTWA